MDRTEMLEALKSESFDILVIGGGATGLGVAVDAASRGFRTALVEAHDFAKGTSSRSTKLVHGGVRYLEQLDFSLVTEALRERGIMYRNAPHLVHNLAFVVPRYSWWEGPFYGVGLRLYDMLAGKLNIARSKSLTREQTIDAIPNVQRNGLQGGIMYHDGQFDDARMAITLARTAATHGAVLTNYTRVVGLAKTGSHVDTVEICDEESGDQFAVTAKVIVNATGIFSDQVRRLEDPEADEIIEQAQGVHLVLDRKYQPSDNAIMVPHTDDGRVLFVIPWHDRVLVGTTDTQMDAPEWEPKALPEEVEFILRNANRYMENDPTPADVLSVFAGQRPLVHPGGKKIASKSISRSHEVLVSRGGLVSICGGKWTTYRKMAEDAMKLICEVGQLDHRDCVTEDLRLHGYVDRNTDELDGQQQHMLYYGSERQLILALAENDETLATQLHPDLPYFGAEVVWAVKHEMARSVEDVLARRTRALFLDARASAEAASSTATLMAEAMGKDDQWIEQQASAYQELAQRYLL